MRRSRACRSLLAPIGWALACGGNPPAFPEVEPSTSGATGGEDAGSGTSGQASGPGPDVTSSDASSTVPGTDTGGSEGTGPTPDDTSTGPAPPPVCRDPDGLCHAALEVISLESDAGPIDAGDLDADGALDLVLGTQNDDLGVLLGLGDGTFMAPQWTPLIGGEGLSSLVVAPFDADATLDVAVARDVSDEVGVLLGDGRGGLVPVEGAPTGQTPHWLAEADFDGDGVLDLAVGQQAFFGLRVLRGLGGGAFTPLPEQVVGFRATSLVATTAFGDAPGLVLTSYLDNQIELAAGNGDGTFTELAQLGVGGTPVHADVRDLDGDGLLDIVSVHRGNNSISVRLAVAEMQYGEFQSYAAIGGPRDAAIADFNLDGLPDVVVCGDNEEGIAIVQGLGDGTFAPPVTYTSGLQHWRLVVADLNADGVPDVASTGQNPSGVFIVLSHAS